jgi:hypothetical protein
MFSSAACTAVDVFPELPVAAVIAAFVACTADCAALALEEAVLAVDFTDETICAANSASVFGAATVPDARAVLSTTGANNVPFDDGVATNRHAVVVEYPSAFRYTRYDDAPDTASHRRSTCVDEFGGNSVPTNVFTCVAGPSTPDFTAAIAYVIFPAGNPETVMSQNGIADTFFGAAGIDVSAPGAIPPPSPSLLPGVITGASPGNSVSGVDSAATHNQFSSK